MLKVETVLQNTADWEKLREGKIGASDANIIMGVSDFCTPRELYLKKKGLAKEEENKSTFVQDKGHRLEEKCRALFELETFMDWPSVVALHSEYSWFMASLDGYNEELNENWECKYVGQEDFEQVKNGHMLSWYVPQVQAQMIVSGAKVCNFNVITEDKEAKENGDFPYKRALLRVEYDPFYCANCLMPALFNFQNYIELDILPPISEKDILPDDENEALFDAIESYKSTKESFEEWKKLEEKAKEKVYSLIKHNKTTCRGHKVTRTVSESKMKIDYETLISDLKIQIDPKYTSMSEPRVTDRVTFCKVKTSAELEEEARISAEKTAKKFEKEAEKARKAQEKEDKKAEKEAAKLEKANKKKK
jgi:putative phage-type endonuclease